MAVHAQKQQDRGLEGIIAVTSWFPKLLETQVDYIATTFTSILPTPSSTTNGGQTHQSMNQTQQLFRKLGYGLLGAVYAATVLTFLMVVSVVVGVFLVNYWVERPVVVREKLYFDYTDAHPSAVFVFGVNRNYKLGGGGGGGGVPVGHTFHVSVLLSVPDSDYNRDMGVFQLTAEVVSTNGKRIARASRPSMLQFHSYPIRLMRTFIMGIPILLGMSHETQMIKVQLLRYKEDSHMRTDVVKITLMPRAGTPYLLPQIYEAEILMHSKLPWVKELVHKWKWTFYVWTSMYVYVTLLLLLLGYFRTLLVSPLLRARDLYDEREAEGEERQEVRVREGKEFSESLRKWQQNRRKRKSALLSMSTTFPDKVGSTSATSYTVTKDDDFDEPSMEEDVGDSESVKKML